MANYSNSDPSMDELLQSIKNMIGDDDPPEESKAEGELQSDELEASLLPDPIEELDIPENEDVMDLTNIVTPDIEESLPAAEEMSQQPEASAATAAQPITNTEVSTATPDELSLQNEINLDKHQTQETIADAPQQLATNSEPNPEQAISAEPPVSVPEQPAAAESTAVEQTISEQPIVTDLQEEISQPTAENASLESTAEQLISATQAMSAEQTPSTDETLTAEQTVSAEMTDMVSQQVEPPSSDPSQPISEIAGINPLEDAPDEMIEVPQIPDEPPAPVEHAGSEALAVEEIEPSEAVPSENVDAMIGDLNALLNKAQSMGQTPEQNIDLMDDDITQSLEASDVLAQNQVETVAQAVNGPKEQAIDELANLVSQNEVPLSETPLSEEPSLEESRIQAETMFAVASASEMPVTPAERPQADSDVMSADMTAMTTPSAELQPLDTDISLPEQQSDMDSLPVQNEASPAQNEIAQAEPSTPIATISPDGNEALENLVKEMLKPMLHDWLDQKLPKMLREAVDDDTGRIDPDKL